MVITEKHIYSFKGKSNIVNDIIIIEYRTSEENSNKATGRADLEQGPRLQRISDTCLERARFQVEVEQVSWQSKKRMSGLKKN
jgi:hypothetical protein